MRLLRFLLSAVSILLLLVGYMLSQYNALFGDVSRWAADMDRPQIRMLAAAIFCLAIIFSFVPEKENETA